ncbi:hypothetical protein CGLO_13402 [Colletotrichum gloeosporioides Cg-14]|uniref:Uncharacterized protein n=1 Tax=Colletotrichum gloeosporioides (strain Cg-14) TaxID=1237896 RepID=T0LGZ9_COLGC|nr:hypothetical protein CGLO_13402 [Colletotrichum gloeosporioides Cg-14]
MAAARLSLPLYIDTAVYFYE